MKKLFLLTLACFCLSFSGAETSAQNNAAKMTRQLTLGQQVSKSQMVSIDKIDHAAWNTLLQKYVDEYGGVDYASLKDSADDMKSLDSYITHLSTAGLSIPAQSECQKAFWINAYNAVTVKGILQEYPTTSIRNHTSENGGYNIWKNLLLNVGGSQASLNDIEHKVLRPMGDPRIHFAIVCASEGCPRLLNEAYLGSTLESQLIANARNFFSQAQNFRHDPARRTFQVSAILEWFGTDFGADQAAQLRAIAPYLPTEAAQTAARSNAVSVSFLDYSWKLNKQKDMKAMTQKMSGTHAMDAKQMMSGQHSMKEQHSMKGTHTMSEKHAMKKGAHSMKDSPAMKSQKMSGSKSKN